MILPLSLPAYALASFHLQSDTLEKYEGKRSITQIRIKRTEHLRKYAIHDAQKVQVQEL